MNFSHYTGVFKIIEPLYLIEKNLSCISKTYLPVYHTCSIDRRLSVTHEQCHRLCGPVFAIVQIEYDL